MVDGCSSINLSIASCVTRVGSMPYISKDFNAGKDRSSVSRSLSIAFDIPRRSNSSKDVFANRMLCKPVPVIREQPPRSSRFKGSKLRFTLRFPNKLNCFAVPSVKRQHARKNKHSSSRQFLQMSCTSKSMRDPPTRSNKNRVRLDVVNHRIS